MFTTETLKIKNPGNAAAHFDFRSGKGSLYTFNPKSGQIPAKTEGGVEITYTPPPKL